MYTAIFALTFVLISHHAEAQTISISNFSFETPTTSGNINDPTGASWTFTNGGGRFAGIANGSALDGVTPPDGSQMSYVQSTSSISQSLSGFVVGATYAMTVAGSYRSGYPADSINITVNGSAISSFTPSGTAFADYTATFVATSSTETLGFVGTTAATNETNLDNVRVSLVATPSTPSNLSATPGNLQVALSWTASSGATSYNVYRGTTSGGEGATPIATGLTGTTYTDTAVTAGTTYYYEVVALNASGNSGPSTEASAIVPTSTASFVKTDTTTLGNWKGVYGADGYNVINDTSGSNYPTYATVTPTGNTAYTWAASSIDPRAMQNVASGTTDRLATCWYSSTSYSTDLNLTGGAHQVAFYLLDWDSNARAETIQIKDKTNGTILDTRSASSFNRGVYYVWNLSGYVTVIVTKTAGANGVISGLFFGTGTGSTAPSIPTNLTATAGANQVTLSWTASAGQTSYNVYRGTTAGGESTTPIATGVTGITYTNTGLTAGTSYYYQVMAVNSVGGSGASNEANATPTLPAPTGLLASATNTQIVLSWSASSGATSYNIYRSITSNGEGSTAYATGITATTYTDAGTTSGQVYYYKVAAVNSVSTSPQSSETGAIAGPVLIDSGSTASFTDSQGRSWSADGLYSGGSVLSTTTAITNVAAADQPLYQYQRTGSTFNYSIPVPNGYYNVTLYFAEIDPSITGSDQRLIDVTANGIFELTDFDIYSAAGGKYHGISRSFLLNVTNSTINLLFESAKGTAAIAGIQIGQPGYGGTAADVPEPGWAAGTVPTDDGADGGEFGPGSSFQVSLPSLVAENSPGEDIGAYNPIGPSVSYSRYYRSALATTSGHTGAPGLSSGWTDNYDLTVTSSNASAWSALTLTYPNNAQESWTPTLSAGVPTGAFNVPVGAPYIVTGVPSSTTGQWTSITVTFKDHSTIIFTPASSTSTNTFYLFTGMANLVGHTVTINRDTAANSYRITSIVNDATPTPTTLLKFSYTGSQLKSIEDVESATASENREVSYGFTAGQLIDVSQIYADGGTVPSDRWTYGYQAIQGISFLQTVTSPDPANVGGTTTASLTYTSQAKVGMATDAVGNLRTYTPVTGGTQVSVYNTDGTYASTWVQKYGTSRNTNTGFMDALNNKASLDYGDAGNPYSPTKYTNRNSQIYQPTYDSFGNLHTYTNPRQVGVTNTWDYTKFALGQLSTTQITSPMTEASTFTYYGSTDGIKNYLVHIVNTPKPDTTYNNSPATVTTTYDYTTTADTTHAGGQVLTIVAPGNNVLTTLTTILTYDHDPSYNQDGTPGSWTPSPSIEYVGQPLMVESAAGDTWHYRYDGRGNRIIAIDPVGNLTSYSYNLADQLVKTTYPATGDTGSGQAYNKYNYQYVGGPLQSIQLYDESNTLVREIDYAYTHEGLLASVTGSTEPASYQYDGAGRVTKLTDGDGNVTSYYYDQVGNLSAIHYPDYNLATGYDIDQFTSYDADQNLMIEIDGRGVEKSVYRDDPESLVTALDYASTLPVQNITGNSYSYDSYGRLSSVSDNTGTTSYSYDDLDEVQTKTRSFPVGGPQNQKFTYSHWPDGSVQALTIPSNVSNPLTTNSGNFTYSYDLGQRLTMVVVPFTWPNVNAFDTTNTHYTAGDNVQTAYDRDGRPYVSAGLWTSAFNNTDLISTKTTYTYNARGFLTSLENEEAHNTRPGTDLAPSLEDSTFFKSMHYDAAGNRTQYTEFASAWEFVPSGDRLVQYTYDTAHTSASQNRDVLTGENSGKIPGVNETSWLNDFYNNTFGYDTAYNLSPFDMFGTAYTFSPNSDNQITSFTYDGEGNPTTYQGSTFTYDPENRLTQISSPAFSAAYDADGLRAWKQEGGATTYYLYDGDKPILEETAGSNNTVTISAVNVWSGDGLRARYYPSTNVAYSFNFDPQGNIVDKVSVPDALDQIVDAYEAYGKLDADYDVNGNSPALHQDPVGFGGQWGQYKDASGLVAMTHRYYDPGTGRFINRDPIGYQGGINIYAYAGGNPVNNFDPSGLAYPSGVPYYTPGEVAQFNKGYNSDEPAPTIDDLLDVWNMLAPPGAMIEHTSRPKPGIGVGTVIYKNGYRTPNGKWAKATGPGKSGEYYVDEVAKRINAKEGWSVVAREITFRAANGETRRYDLIVRDPKGRLLGIECKSGSAPYKNPQKAFDQAINSSKGSYAEGAGLKAKIFGIRRLRRVLVFLEELK
jgi:RHS repeat-associated protein